MSLCCDSAPLTPNSFVAFAVMASRDETCIPCQEGGSTFTAEELHLLCDELPGWEVIDQHHLHKRLSFPDFATALGWLTCGGAICDQQGHHADFRVGWGYVEVDIHTHKVNGITRADAVLAARFDAMTS
jgi:4a-hydroxytetrahydrobiopterin dehydratase